MKEYEINGAKTMDDLIAHNRNRSDLAITDLDTRNEFRHHFAVTDTQARAQTFIEWQKSPVDSPYHGKYVHFTEMMNLRGTAAHEAEHANDEHLGYPSLKDPEFDRLYQEEAGQALEQVKASPDLEFLSYYARIGADGKLDPPAGKQELFAELGAIAVTGEMADKASAKDLVANFPKTYKYVYDKIQSGEW